MEQAPLLLIPGPTPVPAAVQAACSLPMIPHRSAAFVSLYLDVCERLGRLYENDGPIIVLPSSGTGALEAAVVNTHSPGDRVLACVMGSFGSRFADIAAAYGLTVERLEIPWGETPTPEQLEHALQSLEQPVRSVFLTHSETSTGALADVAALVPVIRRHAPDALVLLDMVSSFGGVAMPMKEWDVDVAVAASQKALMTPPGLGIVALSERAAAAVATAKLPRFAWDFRGYTKKPGSPPYTPAVSLLQGLRQALIMIEEEGIAAFQARHRLMSAMARAGVRALGWTPLADDRHASPTVTAALLPAEQPAAPWIDALREEHGIYVAGGMGAFSGRCIRIGHMGAIQPEDVLTVMKALDQLHERLAGARAGSAHDAAAAVFAGRQAPEGAQTP